MGEVLRVFSRKDVLELGPEDVVMIAGRMACRTELMTDAEDSDRPIFFTLNSRERVLMMDAPLNDGRTCYVGGVVDAPSNWRPAGLWDNWDIVKYLKERGL